MLTAVSALVASVRSCWQQSCRAVGVEAGFKKQCNAGAVVVMEETVEAVAVAVVVEEELVPGVAGLEIP